MVGISNLTLPSYPCEYITGTVLVLVGVSIEVIGCDFWADCTGNFLDVHADWLEQQ